MILCISKPVATVLLFAVLGRMPADMFGYLMWSGVVLSLAADITLLAEGNESLVVGLGLSLVAYLCYGLAFFAAGPGGWLAALPGLLAFGACSAWFVRRQRGGIESGLRAPVWVHALVLAVMAGGVFSVLAGQALLDLAVLAALGATLLYLARALLPWAHLRRLSVWAQAMALVLYWGGQLALVLSARWGIDVKVLQ